VLLLHLRDVSCSLQGKLVAERYSAEQDVSEATRSISWSLAKSVTSALVGIRAGDGNVSVHQLAVAPGWTAAEAASRNITSACPTPPPPPWGRLV
jgi:hypothetical protein